MTNDMHEPIPSHRATDKLPRGDERDQLFLTLHEEGLAVGDISRETGWGRDAVRKALLRQGVRWPRRADARKPGPKSNDAMLEAMCNECGSVHTARASYFGQIVHRRPLRCDVCGHATEHVKLTTDFESDVCERINAEQNKENAQSAQLQASLAMLDQLGIRFDYVRLMSGRSGCGANEGATRR